jgi:hypothetical protein
MRGVLAQEAAQQLLQRRGVGVVLCARASAPAAPTAAEEARDGAQARSSAQRLVAAVEQG